MESRPREPMIDSILAGGTCHERARTGMEPVVRSDTKPTRKPALTSDLPG
jgi:hypothetical protein